MIFEKKFKNRALMESLNDILSCNGEKKYGKMFKMAELENHISYYAEN